MIRVYLEMSALLVFGLLAFLFFRWALAKLHAPVALPDGRGAVVSFREAAPQSPA